MLDSLPKLPQPAGTFAYGVKEGEKEGRGRQTLPLAIKPNHTETLRQKPHVDLSTGREGERAGGRVREKAQGTDVELS